MKKILAGILLLAVLAIPVTASVKSGGIHIMSGDPYDCFVTFMK